MNQRKIFLIDGIGACISAFMLGLVLTSFQKWIGMPINFLYILSFWAFCYAVYSLSSYLAESPNYQKRLKIIVTANLIYCCFTMFLLVDHFNEMTSLGFAYFLSEILIILTLVYFEKRLIAPSKRSV